jgi:cytochrome c oxidase subunit IV
MTETHLTQEQQQEVVSHTGMYLRIFFVLLILTILEYCYASFLPGISFFTLVIGLMVMAIIKASLVGLYFMHLKFEGKWVYGMLIPAGILAFILTVALIPDVAMAPVSEDNPDLEGIETKPVQPDAAAWVVRLPQRVG